MAQLDPGSRETLRGNVFDKLSFNVLKLSGSGALDLAYTFFDSVNSKGKALSDFDLLKAHHLIYMPANHEQVARQHNDYWQKHDEHHSELFSTILRRLRMWGRGEQRDAWMPRRDFEEFKSCIEPEDIVDGQHKLNRYRQPHAFSSWRREENKIVLDMKFPLPEAEAIVPTEVTQTIEGGDAFFLFSRRYHGLYQQIFANNPSDVQPEFQFVRSLALAIDNPNIKDAFRAITFLYVDKFGEESLVEVAVCIERILSEKRWKAKRLTIQAILQHVNEHRLVPIILDALNHRHVLAILKPKALQADNPPDDRSGTKMWYFNALSAFYATRYHLIQNDELRIQLQKSYKGSTEQ